MKTSFTEWLIMREEGMATAYMPNQAPSIGGGAAVQRQAPPTAQFTGNIQKFQQLMNQEISTWEAQEYQVLVRAISKHGQAAGFTPQEVQKMLQTIQHMNQTEGLPAAIHFAAKAPDMLLHHGTF
jgi:hypothetical protein